MMPIPPISTDTTALPDSAQSTAIRAAAEKLEASFLAEMLRHTGLTDMRDTLNGGAGESAFSGFLADAYAEGFVRAGGIGLTEHLVKAIAARQDVSR